jgi:methylated-DNA-protein-cysteine methyltransferase-like protein
MTSFTERVWDVVRCVPRGRVVSYGGVAAILGRPRAARGVGRALSVLGEDSDVPWWRVINRNGEISIKGLMHGPALQRALLEAEGVRFVGGRVDWRRFGWSADGLPDGVRTDPERAEPAEPEPVSRRKRRRRG